MRAAIDVDLMLATAAAYVPLQPGADVCPYRDALTAWEALPTAERERRAVQVRAAIAGTPVPWESIERRVGCHSWDVLQTMGADTPWGNLSPENQALWMSNCHRWSDGAPVAICEGVDGARLAARALAEALGYRLDGAPAEVPPPNAWGEHATYERHDRSARATATRALASLLTFSDREGYTLNPDGSRCNPEQDAESRGYNVHRHDAVTRALLAFKAAP